MANQLLRTGIYTSQRLARCPLEVHLAFAYLLPMADQWGRFEYDVRAIWAKVAAYRTDIPMKRLKGWLDGLEKEGLFQRYEVEKKPYAAWMNYRGIPKSQRAKSLIPEPPFDNALPGAYPEPTQRVHIGVGVCLGVGGGEAGEPDAPLSPISKNGNGAWGSAEAFVHLYNDLAPDECPAVEVISDGRRKKIRDYLRQFPDEQFWRDTFQEMRRAPFLRGKRLGHDRRPFIADLDWLLQKGRDGTENAVKVHDGKYQDGE